MKVTPDEISLNELKNSKYQAAKNTLTCRMKIT
jgi:hypothetical protein